jgi:hypothetical protein
LQPIITDDKNKTLIILEKLAGISSKADQIIAAVSTLKSAAEINRKELFTAINKVIRLTVNEKSNERNELLALLNEFTAQNQTRYNTNVYSQSNESALKVTEIKPVYSSDSKVLDGREIMQACFDEALKRDKRIVAFGEDVGKIGDVNQGFAGLQEKYGELRVTDTGIRELSIMGQAIGLAMRGLTTNRRNSVFRLFALRHSDHER